ncbi:retrovirus-related pol polyprotein from transposon tnt 1-94 [Gossypium australe]|uniref:Retrovirus-related pol polyprotein from transposon tnt 1-94 n=1 Tax=Gossypium australe TaxID=47621 RepID=A0A5B6VV38_9ROSI|nr:retrovirus-related pol polyprotein from transposon tnt 1-94 [Gossypium australe]
MSTMLFYKAILMNKFMIEVIPTIDSLFLSQSKYVHDILNGTMMQDSKGVLTQMSSSHHYKFQNEFNPTNVTIYPRTIEKFQYLSFTRSDILFFAHAPLSFHWKAVKHILLYLKQTSINGIWFTYHLDPNLYKYSDNDRERDYTYHSLTIDFMLYFGPNLVNWSPKK